MISVQTVVDRMTATLDSEGSDRYLFDQDFKPAINSAAEWLVAVFNAAFANKKLTEEDLEELITVGIWQASNFSRIYFDPATVGNERWSILRVMPEPVVTPETDPPPLQDPLQSVYRPDLIYVESFHSAKRLTQEKWEENRRNIFEAGNELAMNQLRSYAYLNGVDYKGQSQPEVEIRPRVPGQFVAISYIKYPPEVTSVNDQIGFPKTITNLLVQKALNFISFKQGDRTNLFSVTQNDIATLVQLMT